MMLRRVVCRRKLEAAFRQPLHEIFDEFDRDPVASGSIAQVGST